MSDTNVLSEEVHEPLSAANLATRESDVLPFARPAPVSRYSEEHIVLRFVRRLNLAPSQLLLDVGCGYGRKMEWLIGKGVRCRGVDINPQLVSAAQRKGLDCITAQQFTSTKDLYSAMLMSHIIEHFSPEQLHPFMDLYLDRLCSGGHLIICTPSLWSQFYSDFDHVRPYDPAAIESVFSDKSSQVQYHARNGLRLLDVGLRRQPQDAHVLTAFYMKRGLSSKAERLMHAAARRLRRGVFWLSRGVLGGETTGWIGLFQKA